MLHKVLPNGVEVVLKENHFAKMVDIQCWVGVGSVHEADNQAGMSHFLEHMLFKGTKKRAVGEIAKTVESCGGDINAYTTFDRTVFYLTLNSRHAAEGVDILSDALFHSTFDPEEFDREKEVILEEIRRGNDNPAARLGRRVFEEVFAHTQAARPIIGYDHLVAGYTRDELVQFHKNWYQPNNMTVVAVGDFETKTMMELITKAFGGFPNKPLPTRNRFDVPKREKLHVQLLRGDYQQPRLEIALVAPPLEHADTALLDLTAFALGAGDASRLNRELRDEQGVVTSVGASLFSAKFGGVFQVSSLPSSETYLKAVRETARICQQFCSTTPVLEEELARARANLRADRIYQEETVSGQARTLGFGMTTSWKMSYDDVYATLIEKAHANQVFEAARNWLELGRATVVGMVPENSPLTEDAVREAFLAGIRDGAQQSAAVWAPPVGTVEPAAIPPAIRKEIKPGITLVYRQNIQSELFNLVAVTEGGLRAETAATVGTNYLVGDLLSMATTQLPYEEMLHMVEGRGAVLQGFSGKDSIGLKLQCLNEQATDMLQLWADALLFPDFPSVQLARAKQEIADAVAAENDSPFKIAARQFQEKRFGQHPYRWPVYGTLENAERQTVGSLMEYYRHWRDSGPWVISVVAQWPFERVFESLSDVLASWHPKAAKRDFSAQLKLVPQIHTEEIFIQKQREQTHILMGYPGLSWADKDRATLDVIATILGGSGGRLFIKLRDQESLAYTVSPMVTYGCHPGIFGAYIACAPAKTNQAIEGLYRELDAVKKDGVTRQELERAQQYLLGSHEADLQRGDSQAMTMALMGVYGVGYDDFLTYPEQILKVTQDDVVRVARTVFNPAHRITVAVGEKT